MIVDERPVIVLFLYLLIFRVLKLDYRWDRRTSTSVVRRFDYNIIYPRFPLQGDGDSEIALVAEIFAGQMLFQSCLG
jgi:hypothetical protein